MFDLEVFDASVLRHLQLRTWSESDAFAALVSGSVATLTNDGHLALRSKLVAPALRANAHNWIQAACGGEGFDLVGAFPLKIWYRSRLYWGSLIHLEPMTYRGYREPEVLGNWEDQQPGHTTMTIVSDKETLASLLAKWTSYFSHPSRGTNSTFCVAASGAAIQVRLCCEEVSIEDVIDVLVAASFAIKEQRRGKMILGLSYIQVVTSPEFKQIRVRVEDEYGPFEKI